MDIEFRTKQLLKCCNSLRNAQKQWGTVRGNLVVRRLQQLQAADVLEVMRHLPQVGCHELSGDREGQLAVNVQYPFRLIFEPADNPVPRKEDGGCFWNGAWRHD